MEQMPNTGAELEVHKLQLEAKKAEAEAKKAEAEAKKAEAEAKKAQAEAKKAQAAKTTTAKTKTIAAAEGVPPPSTRLKTMGLGKHVDTMMYDHELFGIWVGDHSAFKRWERCSWLLALLAFHFILSSFLSSMRDGETAMCACVKGEPVGDGLETVNECTTVKNTTHSTNHNEFSLRSDGLVDEGWLTDPVLDEDDQTCITSHDNTKTLCELDVGNACTFTMFAGTGAASTSCDRTVLCCVAYLRDLTNRTGWVYYKHDEDRPTQNLTQKTNSSQGVPLGQYCKDEPHFVRPARAVDRTHSPIAFYSMFCARYDSP